MKQLTQTLRTGKMQILEVPIPNLQQGMVLVKNFYSLISPGTEGNTVKAARKGFIGKALERPQQVKQVLDILKTQGPTQTYRVVMKKLDSYSPLGYSCVGEIIETAPNVTLFKSGDLVACSGITASHAEIVAVPVNLCVKISEGISENILRQAAYNSLGSIALQGIRQADLRVGETCAIIGMGLIGHLTTALLNVSGIKTIGIDTNPLMIDLGKKHGLNLGLETNDPGIQGKVFDFTEGIGCDSVIITAATNSLVPINLAGAIARKKASIVVVGNIPTGFDREPHFYKKELMVKMSCSYGPGRYDPEYEEKGHDYPAAYVRWTEKRNMEAFQDLIAQGKIDISHLTTHTFKLEDAPKAYDMILGKTELYVGILIEYNRTKKFDKQTVKIKAASHATPSTSNRMRVGFIGAGSYAQSYLLPNLSKIKEVELKGVMNVTPASSRSVAEKFGFEFCTGKEEDIIENKDIDIIFISTRHDSHAYYVKKAIEANKHVFVEKPLCLKMDELEEIKNCYEQKLELLGTTAPLLMVGYNRRFSPLTEIVRTKTGKGPHSMLYRINAGDVPVDSWIQDTELGGGRILGEVCHFIDYLTFIAESLPIEIHAVAMENHKQKDDTLIVSLKFQNGSIGSVQYFSNGSKSLPKEYIEIYSHNSVAILNDFRKLKIYGPQKTFQKTLLTQNKGQKNEIKFFIDGILKATGNIIPFQEIYSDSMVTFKIIESLKTNTPVHF